MPEKPSTPPDNPEQESNFLLRWSRRKADAAAPPEKEPALENTASAKIDERSPETAAAEPSTEEPAADSPPPVTEADLENLTYDSDYTKFMGENVPEALRRRALRQLWRSDPILANVDGLCDYDDDYTDAALAVKVLKTAHKVGQGYLTDEEVEANRARGRPAEEPANSEKIATQEDDQDGEDIEDIEDFDSKPDEAENVAVAEAPEAERQDATGNTQDQQDSPITDPHAKSRLT